MVHSSMLHVFFVNNPIVHIITCLIISSLDIKKENIVIIRVRNTDCSLIDGYIYDVNSDVSFLNRLFNRFNYSLEGNKIRSYLEKYKRDFCIYSAWDYEIVVPSLKSRFCHSHFYIEEGQQAYRSLDRESKFFKYYYKGAFCINSKAFPWIPHAKKKVFKDFSILKKIYDPKLIGVKKIGIMPQPHRIPSDFWDIAIQLLAKKVGKNGAIKLHPGFFATKTYKNKIEKVISKENFKEIIFCNNTEILEIEMIHEKKILYGPRTSLQLYCKQFNSHFNIVEFQNYIPSELKES